MTPASWILRPIVWFAAASMVTTTLHELAHAVVAYALGVRSTLYNYSVDLDLTQAQADSSAPAIIGVAGPLFCLGLGTSAWVAYRRMRGSAAGLPLLYFSVFGIGTFFGNLLSTPFVGDFSAIAIALQLPMLVRLALGLAGAVAVAMVHFWAGRELANWVPAKIGRVPGMLGVVAAPLLAGTAVIILVSLPMAGTTVTARVGESFFWVFAAAGALLSKRGSQMPRGDLSLRWVDGAAALIAVLTVRLLVRGIPFAP